MIEEMNERVSVNLLSSRPTVLWWRRRRYPITRVGLHHTAHDGRRLFHIFSVTDGMNFFKLQLDTETLQWTVLEVASGV